VIVNSLFQNPILYQNQYHTYTKDIAFYNHLAQEEEGRVLELGIGTGRLTESILKAGISVVGIDNSTEMLRLAKENLKDYSNNLTLKQSAFSDFCFPEKFSLIFGGFNTLHHLNSLDEFSNLLIRSCKHLLTKGIFAFDLINPHPRMLLDSKHPILREIFFDERYLCACEIWETSEYDAKSQIKKHHWSYYWKNGIMENRTLTHRIFFPEEILGILDHSFVVNKQLYGDFNKSEFSTFSPKQIYVLRFPADAG
jgi:SAM-dependent methyltransferase